ncbi:MAG: hypothetical protein ACKVU2_07405, partial [Saprospiraceae bacterium]
MMKQYRFTLLLVFVAMLAIPALRAQSNCYVRLEDASGYTPNAMQIEALEQAAAELCLAFDSAGFGGQFAKPEEKSSSVVSGQFKVYDFGFYQHHETTAGGYPEPFARKVEEVAALSPYYLLFGKQSDRSGVYTRFWVDARLPDSLSFSCLDATKRKKAANLVENATNNSYQMNGGDYYQYADAEKAGMQKLKAIVEGLKLGNCCPLLPLEIFDNFSKDGFIGIPIVIAGPSAKPSQKNEKERSASGGYILDYSNLTFTMDGESIDLASMDVPSISNAKVFVTKNENFCDSNEDIIGTIETNFNDPELDMATWYHIWENPITSEPDALLFKHKLKKNSSPSFSTQNQTGYYPPPPPFEYTAYQRTFAPWRKFGHLPIPPPIPCFPTGLAKHTLKNSFWGDYRGFSMAKPWPFLDSRNSEKVTSRLNQFTKFKLGQGIIGNNGFSSETRGYENFIRVVCEVESDAMGNPIRVICNNAQEKTTIASPKHKERFGKNEKTNTYLYLQIEGSDPLVSIAPDIDCHMLLYCDPINETGVSYLHVRGVILCKGFPSYESFIQDKFGNSVFIHTFGPSGESQLDKELL